MGARPLARPSSLLCRSFCGPHYVRHTAHCFASQCRWTSNGRGSDENGKCIRDTFFDWIDSEAKGSWKSLKSDDWVQQFKEFYTTDDKLKGILTTVKDNSIEYAQNQLERKVGEGIGKVFDEIVNKLKELFDKGASRGIW